MERATGKDADLAAPGQDGLSRRPADKSRSAGMPSLSEAPSRGAFFGYFRRLQKVTRCKSGTKPPLPQQRDMYLIQLPRQHHGKIPKHREQILDTAYATGNPTTLGTVLSISFGRLPAPPRATPRPRNTAHENRRVDLKHMKTHSLNNKRWNRMPRTQAERSSTQ